MNYIFKRFDRSGISTTLYVNSCTKQHGKYDNRNDPALSHIGNGVRWYLIKYNLRKRRNVPCTVRYGFIHNDTFARIEHEAKCNTNYGSYRSCCQEYAYRLST